MPGPMLPRVSNEELMMADEDVLTELTSDGVLIVTLNRPEMMNALGGGIPAGIQDAAARANRDDDVRAIVFTGAGRGFCAGADLSGGGPARGGAARGRSRIVDKRGPAATVLALAACNVPLIGAINGAAAGAGFGFSLSMDVRIASTKARMGTIFIRRGIGPDWGTSYWLPRLVGIPKAYELLYSGELLDAEAALAVGLVNRVVPHDKLLEEAVGYASMIASGPSIAYTYTRRAMMQSSLNSLDEQLVLEWTQQTELLATDDAREGFKAFLERRDPVFSR
jgi:2-(1,2-epoxy-1,2-dihydrophenyl)acetyl-CoA isomerase